MTTPPEPRPGNQRWLVLAGAVLAALLVGVGAFAMTGQAGQRTPAATTPGSPPAEGPTPVESPVETPSPSPSATPSATPTPSQEQTPYCKAVARIRDGGLQASNNEGTIDFDELSDQFADLIERYSAAAKHAPASLADDYRTALAYQREMKKAVDSRNLEGIKKMVRNLRSLNQTMERIQTESERLCG